MPKPSISMTDNDYELLDQLAEQHADGNRAGGFRWLMDFYRQSVADDQVSKAAASADADVMLQIAGHGGSSNDGDFDLSEMIK